MHQRQMKRRKKQPEPDKEYVSATEIALRLKIPKEIILRVIEDGKALRYKTGDGDIWFERKDLPSVAYDNWHHL